MGENSKISWTDHTFNPWWGCVKVSEGCKNCYAETFSKRYGYDVWGPNSKRRFFGKKHWNEPLKWNAKAEKEGRRMRVFCASMADVFEDRYDLVEPRARLFELIDNTPNLDWLLLTKRSENLARFYPSEYPAYENVWLGTTIEMQKHMPRIINLIEAPAKVHFISIEPMLEPINLAFPPIGTFRKKSVWVIVGGESGSNHRPFEWDWARDVRDQCKHAGVPFFMKQGAGKSQAHIPKIPDDLMIREFPE